VDHSIEIIDPAVAPRPARPGCDGVPWPMYWDLRRRSGIDPRPVNVLEVIPGYDLSEW